MTLLIEPVPCLRDNYAYLVVDRAAGVCAVVDPSEAGPVRRILAERGLTLTHILNTHHHHDHVGGNMELKAESGAVVIAPAKDRHRIPGFDRGVGEGDLFPLGPWAAHVLEIPGHTSGHVAYWFEQARMAFTGDTLFAMGCGRIFEGTPEMMWASLSRLMALPPDTSVYCGHEYTETNGRFALTVEADNKALQARMAEVRTLRAKGAPMIPSTIARELATNPFFRASSTELRATLGMETARDVDVFAETRRRKDAF